jgi:hypothetical protein
MKDELNCAKRHTPDRCFFVLCIFAFLLFFLFFSGCAREEQGVQPHSQPSDGVETVNPSLTEELNVQDLRNLQETLRPPSIEGDSIGYFARILRTPPKGKTAGVSTDPVLLRSGNELNEFLQEVMTGWQFAEEDMLLIKTVYNDDFFKDKVLIAGALGLNSGSIQVGIEKVIQTEDHLAVMFNFTFPETGTCDMMSWHYFVEVETDEAKGREVAQTYLPDMSRSEEAE